MNKLNRLEGNKRGAALVELAIMLPILVFIVFGITEMGRALYQQSILTRTVDSAVRMLSRAHGAIDETNLCEELDPWAVAQEDATNLLVYGDVDGGEEPILDGLNVTEIAVERRKLQDYEKWVCIIIIRAEAPFSPVLTEVPYGFPAFNLRAEAEHRYIGE